MQSSITDLKELDAEVVAICVDSPQQNLQVARKHGLDFPILSDPDGMVIDAYGMRHPNGNSMEGSDIARPGAFLIDRTGKITWRYLPDNYRIRVRPEMLIEALKQIE